MTMENLNQITVLMDECVAKLACSENLLLLVDGREMARAALKVRKKSLEVFKAHSVKKMAIFGGDRMSRMTHMFLSAILGKDRMRDFDTEDEARAWLLC